MVSDDEIIARFHGLYGGGRAQALRDAGNPDAMPPSNETSWLGHNVVKCPMDLWVYQEIIVETKPDVLLECGTSGGGSAFYFASLFDILGHGRVVTVDKDAYWHLWKSHPRITYLVGDSTSDEVMAEMRRAAAGKRTMVSLDSLHTYAHVKRELDLYGPLVTPSCYLICEDTGLGTHPENDWCWRSVSDFLQENPDFTADHAREKHLLSLNHGGWMRRIS